MYIFARGTTSKSTLISHKFNYSDTNITHIGIGYSAKGKVLIYNVIDNGNSLGSALVIDSISSFIESEDVFYFSIWEYANSKAVYPKLIRALKAVAKKKIKFDSFFSLNNNALYCSEFCYKILATISLLKRNYFPRTLNLDNELYEKILNRKVLHYFPVDFFQTGSVFTKIFEIHL
ncbi:MAG: hypothetical protein H7Y86_11545 [Rhizobacter sp.]|nr:hypothetical protein [Ferruginibacter sp.]